MEASLCITWIKTLYENARPWILFLWVSYYVLCISNITSLCHPVFPFCHISTKQLLIKHYLKHVLQAIALASLVRLHQYKLCT